MKFFGADCSRGLWLYLLRKLKKGATENDCSTQKQQTLSGDQTKLFDIQALKVAMQ